MSLDGDVVCDIDDFKGLRLTWSDYVIGGAIVFIFAEADVINRLGWIT